MSASADPSASGSASPGRAPSAEGDDAGATGPSPSSVEFAVATRTFLHGQVTLADGKAAVVLTIGTLLIAYVLRSGGRAPWVAPPAGWDLSTALALAALVALGASLLGALAVVVPRYSRRAEGFVFWGSILEHPTPGDYAREVLHLDDRALEFSLLEDCHRLAAVCARKFRILRWTLWSAGLGLLLGLTSSVLS